MRRRLLFVWLSVVGMGTCGSGVVLYIRSDRCTFAFWLCQHQSIVLDLAKMGVPLVLLVAGGLFVGIRQLMRTRRGVQQMLALPQGHLPPLLTARAIELGIDDRLDVVSQGQAVAFCYGLLRPRICVTTGLVDILSPAEVEAVLRHERHHLQCRDPLRSLLWAVLSGTCWWLEERAQYAHLLRELAADRAVIGEQGRQPLASALLKLLTQPRSGVMISDGLGISGLSVTDARIDQLLKSEQEPPSVRLVDRWLVLPVLIATLLLPCSVVMMHV
jgi:hypothetical protein